MDAPRAEDEESADSGEREDRGDNERGRRRRRRRGRGRRPLETDGGENLDFLATEPPHAPQADAAEGAPVADDESPAREREPAAPRPARRRGPRVVSEPVLADAEQSPEEVAPAPYEPPAPTLEVVAAPAPAEPEIANAPEAPDEPYEPDLERREKFFARLSKWGKK
jgi:ribonuclease E